MNRIPVHYSQDERLNFIFACDDPTEMASRFVEATSETECYNSSMVGAFFRQPIDSNEPQTGLGELEGEEICSTDLMHPFQSFATVLVYPVRPTTREIKKEAIEMLGEPPAAILEKLNHSIFSNGEALAQDNFKWKFGCKVNGKSRMGRIPRTRTFYVFDNDAEPLEKEDTCLAIVHDGQTVRRQAGGGFTSSIGQQTSEVYKHGVASIPTKVKRASNKYKNSRNGETVYVFVTVDDNETFDCAFLDFPLIGHHITAAVMRKEKGYSSTRSQIRFKALTFVFPIEKSYKPETDRLSRWGSAMQAFKIRAQYEYVAGPLGRVGLRTPGYLKEELTPAPEFNDVFDNNYIHCTVCPIVNGQGPCEEGQDYAAQILQHFRYFSVGPKPRAITIFMRTVLSRW
nr:hypothetical protein [Sicyoidochytrium minutum DNA virus]